MKRLENILFALGMALGGTLIALTVTQGITNIVNGLVILYVTTGGLYVGLLLGSGKLMLKLG